MSEIILKVLYWLVGPLVKLKVGGGMPGNARHHKPIGIIKGKGVSVWGFHQMYLCSWVKTTWVQLLLTHGRGKTTLSENKWGSPRVGWDWKLPPAIFQMIPQPRSKLHSWHFHTSNFHRQTACYRSLCSAYWPIFPPLPSMSKAV